ncbi:dioxygenase [Spongiibacter sp. KMU-158]|uniref:Dioxygenase n=1 Tax=Spongiibacter pelagi TaxID=2760804 RepID=A0A927GWV8_9GAMM|nr:class III extradiol ring-cleavage dioxygenase [Spongiibacter pelagi]MBD2859518.1 dioxygenase [Spongiibacter pelagi]
MSSKHNTIFISHGGGPLPLLGDPAHEALVKCLQQIAAEIPRPDAILVLSAHWEEAIASVTAAAKPDLLYDYYGFPAESYAIEYPCPGHPSLAKAISIALNQTGVSARLESERGLDHGVFVPLKIMYPEANIPCVQLSLLSSLDPEAHIAMGEALANLDWDNLLVIGSGFTFHNLPAFFRTPDDEFYRSNQRFEAWLEQVCMDAEMPEAERRQQLIDWSSAPGGRYSHPREEHLLPLHVCYGVAKTACVKRYSVEVMQTQCSMYLW